MELHLLSSAMSSRDSTYLILDYITAKNYSREFQILIGKIKEYYDKDADAQHVVKEVFLGLLEGAVPNKKHLENFTNILNEAEGMDTSNANTQELILKAKLNEVGNKLSIALVNGDETVSKLLEEYRELRNYTTLEELTQAGTEMLTVDDLDRVLQRVVNKEGQAIVYPLAFNERLNGRAAGGHHIVTFARPEMGKSAFNITMACGFARQQLPGIYFINEDRVEDIYVRLISNLTGLSLHEIEQNPGKATQMARDHGLEYVRLISLAPGTPAQVEAFVDKYRPFWMVMDQLRNLNVKEANKVLQLEYATSAMRNIAKKYNVLTISSTQAGDSAENKKLLTMGDVDFSNTGVAAQADVLVGIGGDPLDVQEGRRIINISKNKLSGKHENFPVKIVPSLSRYLSYRGQEQGE